MRWRYLMKTITTSASIRKTGSSADAMLHPELPTPGSETPRRTPMWRIDATMGTVLGVAGRMTAARGGSASKEGSFRNAR
jgi:hypothetical protein